MAKKSNPITTTDLGNGFVRLVAKKGYVLVSERLNRAVSEAVVKPENAADFKVVKA